MLTDSIDENSSSVQLVVFKYEKMTDTIRFAFPPYNYTTDMPYKEFVNGVIMYSGNKQKSDLCSINVKINLFYSTLP